jgi:hypothetical protein
MSPEEGARQVTLPPYGQACRETCAVPDEESLCAMTNSSDILNDNELNQPNLVRIDGGAIPFAVDDSGSIYQWMQDEAAWLNIGQAGHTFSYVPPAEGAGTSFGQLFIIRQTSSGDAEIDLYDCQTQTSISAQGSAVGIASSDDGDTWCINTAGGIFRWNPTTGSWGNVPSPHLASAIAVASKDSQFIVARDDNGQQQFYRTKDDGQFWLYASPPEVGAIAQISTNSDSDLVCIMQNGNAYLYFDETTSWQSLGDDDVLIRSISIRDPQNTWIVQGDGTAVDNGAFYPPDAHLLTWDAADVWDETKSTHLFIVERAARNAGASPAGDAAVLQMINTMMNPGVREGENPGPFRTGMVQGLFDADYVSPYDDPIVSYGNTRPTWLSHFYNDETGYNYLRRSSPTALTRGLGCLTLFYNIMASPGAKDLNGAGYNLGLALHYFTDLTQPMHANGYTWYSSMPFGYHTMFEEYVMLMQDANEPNAAPLNQPPAANAPYKPYYDFASNNSRHNYYDLVIDAHNYWAWKSQPDQWQQAVLPIIPEMLREAIEQTSFLIYLAFSKVHFGTGPQ